MFELFVLTAVVSMPNYAGEEERMARVLQLAQVYSESELIDALRQLRAKPPECLTHALAQTSTGREPDLDEACRLLVSDWRDEGTNLHQALLMGCTLREGRLEYCLRKYGALQNATT